MRALLTLLLFSQLAAADFLEIRKVVEAGKGSKTYDEPGKAGSKLTVSDELIVGDAHVADAMTMEHDGSASVAVKLNAAGEQRMVAATKDGKAGVLRLAVILDGKLKTAPRVMSVPLGKNFVISADSVAEAKELTAKLRPGTKPAPAAAAAAAAPGSFEIRCVVEAGQGTLKVKLRKSEEELTLSDSVIVSRKDLADFWKLPAQAQHEVSLILTDEGEKRMVEATKDGEPGKLRLAILIDGKAVAAPVVNAVPLGKNAVISLGSGEDDKTLAEEIVAKLKAGERP